MIVRHPENPTSIKYSFKKPTHNPPECLYYIVAENTATKKKITFTAESESGEIDILSVDSEYMFLAVAAAQDQNCEVYFSQLINTSKIICLCH